MEAAEGEGRAVGRDEEVASPEIRRERRDEMELDRPLGQARRDRDVGSPAGLRVAGDVPGQAAGAAGMGMVRVGPAGDPVDSVGPADLVVADVADPVDLGGGRRAPCLQDVVEGGLGSRTRRSPARRP
ncbi:MAG: hypothetical protein MZW92_67105 [Comamonadaceae bacterium]|nr:hypothetical protein [Comamonadaceae bacterium]